MPLYTGTGDEGHTGLFGNRRVPKDDARIEAYGTVDELNSVIGLLRTWLDDKTTPSDEQLASIQHVLFEIGADLATEGGEASVPRVQDAVGELEGWIDASEKALPELRTFVLPGGSRIGATLHLMRTVARRAERCYWTLHQAVVHTYPVPEVIGVYLNRLSDLSFSWARLANQQAGVEDIPWQKAAPK
ncbi:MAG: cob(I)yrinic acid a,c-diamide adenosyltransferase [Planctomycetota bacterium]